MTGIKFEGASGRGESKLPNGVTEISSNDSSKKIFLSKPGVLDLRQEHYISRIKGFIAEKGYECEVLERGAYDQSQVLSKLSKLIDGCCAIIVFGFRSTYIKNGTYRDNTEDFLELEDVFLTTPWSHIEVGIAAAKNRQILLLSEDNIHDGVFDESVKESTLTKYKINSCLKVNELNIESWFESLK